MKISHFLLTTSLCAVVAMPAFAQARKFSDVDQNDDGMLSEEELVDAFDNAGAASILLRSDMDKDGKVSIREIKMSHDDDESDDEDGRDDSDDDDDDSDESNDSEDDDDSDESNDSEDDDDSDDDDDEDDDDDDSDDDDDDDEDSDDEDS